MRAVRTRPDAAAVAVVGLGAILPDAPDAPAFWRNVKEGRYSITEVPKERWDPDLYYDPDPKAPDKTYSKIGGWVREGEWEWDPLGWHLPIPPRSRTPWRTARSGRSPARARRSPDYGFPGRPLDQERTAVILGNALAGERQLLSRPADPLPEFAEELAAGARASLRCRPRFERSILEGVHAGVGRSAPR